MAKVTVPVTMISPPASRHPFLRPLQLRKILERERPDLVLTYNWGAMEAVLAARSLAIPVVHAEDGFGPEEAWQLLKRRVWAKRILLRTVSTTVVPSRTLEKIALESYRLPAAQVTYIPNGVDLNRFYPGRALEIRQRLGIQNCEIVFGTVGGLRPEKNLDFLLRAFHAAAVPASRLVIVGEGDCRQQLERMAAELGMVKRVCFAGLTEDPAEYYRAFDVFVMSSVTEQMPLSLLEAMASGLPAVCTEAGDTEVLLGTNSAPELIRQGDALEYAAALQRFAREEGLRNSVGNKNRARCKLNYSLSSMTKAYLALYRQF